MEQWKMISKGAMAFCVVLGVYTGYDHFTHHHEHQEPVEYAYLKLRTKPFPWKYSDCSFFDFECKRKAKLALE